MIYGQNPSKESRPIQTVADGRLQGVIGAIANPSANFSVPGSVVTYSIGDLIANSATAGSVAPMQHTITRTAAGAAAIVKGRFYKTGTGIVGASFRQHFFTSSPTVTNGDDGVFLPNQCLTRIGSLDYNLADMVVHSDGVSCMGIPTSGYPITVDLPSGSVVYSLIEARGAYVRTAGETITTVAEVEQE